MECDSLLKVKSGVGFETKLYQKFFSNQVSSVKNKNSKLVVLFKSQPEDDEMEPYHCMDLSDSGFIVAVIYVMDFDYVNQDALKRALLSPESYSGMILTSPRAVKAVNHVLQDFQGKEKCLCAWQQKKNFVIGKRTWTSTETNLGIQAIGQESGNSIQLVKTITETLRHAEKNLPYLFPCSKMRLNVLIENLKLAGVSLEEVVCYSPVCRNFSNDWCELHAVIRDLGKSNPDILVFFSPSAVKFVQQELAPLDFTMSNYQIIALGPSTSKELTSIGIDAVVCDEPSPEGVKRALKLANQSSGGSKTQNKELEK